MAQVTFKTKDIRNVCMLGHGHSGKTSLCESMLFKAGAIDRAGKIADGNTVSDFDSEEIKRQISINASVLNLVWDDTKINILDTPGYFDFAGEQIESAAVCGSAVIVVSGKSGVSAGTEKAWALAKDKAKIIFVNKVDDVKADYYKVIMQLDSKFGKAIAPFTYPIKDGDKFKGFVDIIKMKAKIFTDDGTSQYVDIPADYTETANKSREMLNEAVAEVSEELMQKYFDGIDFTEDEIRTALKTGIKDGTVVPVLCGSVNLGIGIARLMDIIVKYFPAPDEFDSLYGTDKDGEIKEIVCSSQNPVVLRIFKTVVDSYVGKMSYFKVLSGILKPDVTLFNANKGENEKLTKIYTVFGKKQTEVPYLEAGDIGAVTKLQFASTSDTLCDAKQIIKAPEIEFCEPVMSLAVVPKAKGDEEKINSCLNKIREEDPTFKVKQNNITHQTIISGTGEMHINVIVSKLKNKFGVDVSLTEPKIEYKEAIRKKVKAEGKHKKQSGGHGQYGHVWIEFEPSDTDGLVFEEKVFGGSVPKNFFPAVEKGIKESMQHGTLAGFPISGLKATLLDGSYHPVDSSEMAFKTAAALAYKAAIPQANPVILEPIGILKAAVNNEYTGDVVGDINKRRGKIMGMNPIDSNITEVEANVPVSEMTKYATDLRALTNGRGTFSFKFDHYEQVPEPQAAKIIENEKNK